jgi:hypothetical protein
MSENAITDHDPAQAVARACDVVAQALSQTPKRPEVISFFDEPTNTASRAVRDPASRRYGKVVLAEFICGGKIAPSFPIAPRKSLRSEFNTTHRERYFAEARVA